MPRTVPHSRGTLAAGTVLAPSNRGQWLRCASTDTVARFGLDRALDHDLLTDTITGQFIPWTEGDPFREVCRWAFEASYDNGNTWESLGGGATGPEVVRKPTEDPDATKPVLLKTQAWFPLRPQVGNTARFVRWVITAIEGMETEVEVESDDSRPPRLPVTSTNSVALEDSASGSAAGASSVTTGNANQSGTNKAAFAFLSVAGSTSLTVSNADIDNATATLVTGSNVQNTGGPGSEMWCYYRVNPSGPHDADFTVSSTANDIFAALLSLSDVDQTTPYNNFGSDTNTYFPSTFNGTTATSATDERVIDCCAITDWSATTWTGTPDTAAFPIDISSGETILRSGHEAGAASVTIGYDYTASASSAIYSWLNVNQVAAAAANPKGPLGMPFHGPFAGPVGP